MRRLLKLFILSLIVAGIVVVSGLLIYGQLELWRSIDEPLFNGLLVAVFCLTTSCGLGAGWFTRKKQPTLNETHLSEPKIENEELPLDEEEWHRAEAMEEKSLLAPLKHDQPREKVAPRAEYLERKRRQIADAAVEAICRELRDKNGILQAVPTEENIDNFGAKGFTIKINRKTSKEQKRKLNEFELPELTRDGV